MATSHREFLPKQDSDFGYHWHLSDNQRQPLTRYSENKGYTQLVRCMPAAFQRANHIIDTKSLVVKVKLHGLRWSMDFGQGSRCNANETLLACHEPHAQLVYGAIRALRKAREVVVRNPFVNRIVVATESANMVKRAAWGQSLDANVDTRLVRQLYRGLEADIRVLERRGCKVLFWLQ